MLIKPGKIRLISLILAIIIVLPLPIGIFTGLYLWMSPFIMLNTIIAKTDFFLFNLLGLLVLVLITYKNRFFCRYLCPTGVLCDSVSRFAEKKVKKRKFPSISKSILIISIILSIFDIPILTILDPINIFNTFFDVFHSGFSAGAILKTSGLWFILIINLIFPHSWCQKICPLGGLQFLVSDIKAFLKRTKESRNIKFSENRRYIISGVLGIGAGILLPKILKTESQPVLRPPGALPYDELRFTCARCGNCLKTCPTNIIQPLTNSGDWMNILTPRINFAESYCLPECTLCGEVCPTGAIQRFTAEQKRQLYIGTAELIPELCLLTKNQECDRCRFYCDFDAIDIVESGNYSVIPKINKELCIGCGACQVVCPTNAIEIKTIS